MSLQKTDPNSNGSPEETLVGRDYLQRDGQDERTQEGVLETPEAANSSPLPSHPPISSASGQTRLEPTGKGAH